LTELLNGLIALFGRKGTGVASFIALLKYSSGRFASCLEAIKGEAMIELAAVQRGNRIIKVGGSHYPDDYSIRSTCPTIKM
jgi:hypothetical protein